MVDTNYSYRVNTYIETYTETKVTTETETTALEQAQTADEILATVFTKMLNEAVAADPEWADLAQRLAAQGKMSLELDLADFGIDFNELTANAAPDMFVPASLLRDRQELASLVLDAAKLSMGEKLTKAEMQKVAEIESSAWQEAVIQYAFSVNTNFIDLSEPEKPTQPMSKDIHREVNTAANFAGTFSVKNVLMTAKAPAPAANKTKEAPKAPPPVNYANYKSASLHDQFLATKAASQPKTESADAVEERTGVLNFGLARAVSTKFSSFLATCAADGIPTNVYDIIQWVLREAYMEGLEDLVYRRDKVMLANKAKAVIRKEMAAARAEKSRLTTEATKLVKEAMTNYPAEREAAIKKIWEDVDEKYGTGSWIPKTIKETEANNALLEWERTHRPDGGNVSKWIDEKLDEITNVKQYALDMNHNPPQMVETDKTCTTKEALDDYIKDLENKISSIGDDAQLSNVDLQALLEKQQELIKTLSNLGKLLHDTALAIIRKIG